MPKGIIQRELSNRKSFRTLAGTLSASQIVTLRDVHLPKFDTKRHIEQQRALIFDSEKCKYDLILGANFLSKVGINLDHDTGNMEWYNSILPTRPRVGLTSTDFDDMEDQYFTQLGDEILGKDWSESFATEILDATYEFTDVATVVNDLQCLDQNQKDDLLNALRKHQQIFDGTLGIYPHEKFHIDIDPDAKPVYSRPYPVPRIHYNTFKKELDHLVKIGVLVIRNESGWASPTFIIPKRMVKFSG